MRILLVDPDILNRNVMTRFLTGLGGIEAATDGRQGCVAFSQALKTGEPFDLVVVDASLPKMKTVDVLRAMRMEEEALGFGEDARACILVTASLDSVGNVSAAFRTLCDDFLMKPPRKPLLMEKLAALGLPVPI